MSKKQLRSIFTLLLVVTLIVPFFATPVSASYENTYSNTGNMRDDIIGVALTQVGYTEGTNNYTKYGAAYGMHNCSWGMIFVWWCFRQAGASELIKKTASCTACWMICWKLWWTLMAPALPLLRSA